MPGVPNKTCKSKREKQMARTAIEEFAVLIARVIMSAPFVWTGYTKLVTAAGTQAYFAKLGLPLPVLAWSVAVAVELLCGLALLLGIQARVAGLILAAWCIATALVAHSNFNNPDMVVHFLKNVIMAGGFLYVAVFGAGAYSLWPIIGQKPS
jgi:putative oxidoreductase